MLGILCEAPAIGCTDSRSMHEWASRDLHARAGGPPPGEPAQESGEAYARAAVLAGRAFVPQLASRLSASADGEPGWAVLMTRA